MATELRQLFDHWAHETQKRYGNKQWLLSKWEIIEGVEWPRQKIDLMIKNIRDGLDLRKSDVLLDLGCGGGWISGALASHARKVFGLDFSEEMLRCARQMYGRNIFVCGEIGKLPFKSEVADRVLAYFVLINIDDDRYIEGAIREIMRVLKKGGRALVGQLPDKDGSGKYDKAKARYREYCQSVFKLGQDVRGKNPPMIKLFDRKRLADFLRSENIRYQIRDSFNPFYRPGEPLTADWRFDLVLENA